MDTIRIQKHETKMVAHWGVSGLELRYPMEKDAVRRIVEVCKTGYCLEKMVFIAVDFQNLIYVHKYAPDVAA